MIGGLLLVLPGFLTDTAGLLLLIPSVQRRLIDAPALRRNRPAGQVLELDRSQWRDLPNNKPVENGKSAGDRLDPGRRQP